jgi:hypothetical protein
MLEVCNFTICIIASVNRAYSPVRRDAVRIFWRYLGKSRKGVRIGGVPGDLQTKPIINLDIEHYM